MQFPPSSAAVASRPPLASAPAAQVLELPAKTTPHRPAAPSSSSPAPIRSTPRATWRAPYKPAPCRDTPPPSGRSVSTPARPGKDRAVPRHAAPLDAVGPTPWTPRPSPLFPAIWFTKPQSGSSTVCKEEVLPVQGAQGHQGTICRGPKTVLCTSAMSGTRVGRNGLRDWSRSPRRTRPEDYEFADTIRADVACIATHTANFLDGGPDQWALAGGARFVEVLMPLVF